MDETKYPEYVTTDSTFWNSADEAYFFVSQNKAKRLPDLITPIIENAFESGMIREATQPEIDEYLLEQEVEKRIREGRIFVGKNWNETVSNYIEWKKSYDQINKNKQKDSTIQNKPKPIDKKDLDDKKNSDDKKDLIGNDNDKIDLSPTQNAINQKPSVSTTNMN